MNRICLSAARSAPSTTFSLSALAVATALGLLAPMDAALACASCGCTLSPDWDNPGLSGHAGFRLDLRYDFLDQNQLRSGTGRITPAAASQVRNDGEPQEVEAFTRNDYLTASLDGTLTPDWGVNLQLPYIVRSHRTLGTASDGHTPGADGGQYDSRTTSLGDARLIGRYQGLLPSRNLALLFGLKLATGSHSKTGTSTDPGFTDPVPIDRGLQPGTGTNDVILGASWVGALAPDWSYMLQGLFQSALGARGDYRPGNGVNLNAGLRYTAWASVQPQLQFNARHARRDIGPDADEVSTGGTLVYLSPGVNLPLSPQTALYGYTQLPVYQRVNGVQLVPRYSASVGVRHAF